MLTLKERAQQALDAGFTNAQLAAAAGVTSGAVSQWLTTTKKLKAESVIGLAKLTGWSVEWWAEGKGRRVPGVNNQAFQSGTTPERLDEDQETDPTKAHTASHTQLQHTHTSAAVGAGQQTISPDEVFKRMSARERLRFAHLLAAAFDDPPEIGVTVEGELWVRYATQDLSEQEAEQRARETRMNQSGVVVNPPAKKTKKGHAA